jgi:dTDP-4-amino-4,6-dideoxygalactose transaminase/predicted dehydrogenase
MKEIFRKLPPSAKDFVKSVARQTIGRLPPPRRRLTGKLARFGGTPVRDVRFRPWASYHAKNARYWTREVGPALKRIFVTGKEGLPQTLTNELAVKWADYCGVRHALILPHGTDALRIAIASALDHDGLDYGGEILIPNFSFVASANAALDRRFGVALVDVDPDTLNIDPKRLEEAMQPGRTKAIMPVHLFGQPADMTALQAIARKHNLKIIEDAAQAHGAIHQLGRAGSLGDAAGFSFQSFKNISCGEGGALTTDDPNIYERAWQMHNVGRARIGGQRWGHETLGWNCRSTEYVAAILLHRLRLLEDQQARRFQHFMLLRELVKDIPAIAAVGIGPGVVRHGIHMAAFRYQPDQCGGVNIDDYLEALVAEGVPGGRVYPETISQQPAFQKLIKQRPAYVRVLPTPVSDRAVREVFYIDQNVFLGTEADMEEIAAAFRKVQNHYAPKAWSGWAREPREKLASVISPAVVATPVLMQNARKIRFGIIGLGVMGRHHAAALKANQFVSLAAVTDTRPDARSAAEKLGAKWFASPELLMNSREIDAIVIATPHWQHAQLAIAGFRAGLHVVCEKPLAVTVAEADEILENAAHGKGLFAVVHQTRFEPAYQYAKRLLDSGELGPIYRCSMIESLWRTNAYYRSSPWRGTWKGEGGGVLLNQAPHVLDRYVWLCGLPKTVTAHCETALHTIEVEDMASALLRHSDGANGYLHVSTNESPFVSRTEIACDRGRILIENGRVRVQKLNRSIREATSTDSRPWGELESESREIPGDLVNSFEQLLAAFYDNFAQAVNGTNKLVSPGQEALGAVELANAMILSSAQRCEVHLPLDRGEYERFISEKLDDSSPRIDEFEQAVKKRKTGVHV